MKTILFLILLTSLISCSKHEKTAGDIAKVPQTLETKSEHKRLYFKFDDGKVKYKGFENISTFEHIDPAEISEEIKWKFIKVQFINSENVLYFTYIQNAQFVSIPDPRFIAYNQSFIFFVDLPDKYNLNEVSKISLTYFYNNTTLDISSNFLMDYKPEINEADSYDETKYRVLSLYKSGPSSSRLDFVILGDGYQENTDIDISSDETLLNSKFGKDAKTAMEILLSTEPFKTLKDSINIWVVATPSIDSGIDNPLTGEVKNTFYDATFGYACVDRLATPKNELRALKMATLTPFDSILMIINSSKYGGSGGVITTASVKDEKTFRFLALHELGHSLAELSDTYFYFTDDSIVDTCENKQLGNIVIKKHTGGPSVNIFSEIENNLSPNLTLFGDLEKARWTSILTKDSPVVSFDYPVSQAVMDRNERSLTFSYKRQVPTNEIILLPAPAITEALLAAKTFEINGKQFNPSENEISTYIVNSVKYRFFKFFDSSANSTTQIKIVFHDAVTCENIYNRSFDAHMLILPSQIFNPNDLGLFQGAKPSLEKTWRSSFTSIMREYAENYNTVEAMAIANIIKLYAGLSN